MNILESVRFYEFFFRCGVGVVCENMKRKLVVTFPNRNHKMFEIPTNENYFFE